LLFHDGREGEIKRKGKTHGSLGKKSKLSDKLVKVKSVEKGNLLKKKNLTRKGKKKKESPFWGEITHISPTARGRGSVYDYIMQRKKGRTPFRREEAHAVILLMSEGNISIMWGGEKGNRMDFLVERREEKASFDEKEKKRKES